MAIESVTSKTSVMTVENIADEIGIGDAIKLSTARMDRQSNAVMRPESRSEQARLAREKLDKAVSDLTEFAQTMKRELTFHVDDITGRIIVRVVNMTTDKIVRHIHEEEILAMTWQLETMLNKVPVYASVESGG